MEQEDEKMLAVVIVIMTMKMITRKLFHMHESRMGRIGVAVDNRTAAAHFPRAGVDVLFFAVQEKPKQNQLTHLIMCTTLFSPVAYSFGAGINTPRSKLQNVLPSLRNPAVRTRNYF